MKISVNSVTPVGEIEQFAYLRSCGYDATDFTLSPYFEKGGMFSDIMNVTDEMLEEHFSMLRREAEKAGIEIGQTHSSFSGHPRLHSSMEEMYESQKACIKATHYLGCKYCVIHPIIMRERIYDKYQKENFDISYEFYKQFIPTLEEYDVYCCVENMWNCDPIYKNICSTIFSHAEEMVAMCEALGDRFKICLDIGHCTLTGDDPIEMIRVCGDKLACLHCHDNDGISDLHTYPYSRFETPYSVSWKPIKIDWEEVMKALDDVNYKGNLNFEIAGEELSKYPVPINKASLVYLSEIAKYLISLRKI